MKTLLQSQYATLCACCLIVAVSFIAYSNSFNGPFVFDDIDSVVYNKTLRETASLRDTLLTPGFKGETVNGRPLVNLSLAFNYRLGALDVRGYHIVNWIIHSLAALALYGVTRRSLRLLRNPTPRINADASVDAVALFVALLWVAHPLLTESVTYVVQRAEAMAGLFCFLTLYLFLRSRESARPWLWLWASVLTCLLGMGCKETMYAAPILVLLSDRILAGTSWREIMRGRKWYYTALVLTWIPLAALMFGTGRRGDSAGLGLGVGVIEYFLTQCGALVNYIKLCFWPSPLVFDYGMGVGISMPRTSAWLLIMLVLFAITLRLVQKSHPAGFCGACFFLILAPSSSFLPVITQTVAEHRMYMPSAAIIAVCVPVLFAYARRAAPWVCGAATLVFCILTHARNQDYKTEERLWTDTVAKCPGNPRAHYNLANVLVRLKKNAEALPHYAKAESLYEAEGKAPDRLADVYYNHGNTLAILGRMREAEESYRAGLRYNPDDAVMNMMYGKLLLSQHCPQEAVPWLRNVVRLQPQAGEAYLTLGNALLRSGLRTEAMPYFEEALKRDPRQTEAHTNLGTALAESGRPAEALPHFESAASNEPANPVVLTNLGSALLEAGRYAEGRAQLQKAVAIRADYAPARDLLHQLDQLMSERTK